MDRLLSTFPIFPHSAFAPSFPKQIHAIIIPDTLDCLEAFPLRPSTRYSLLQASMTQFSVQLPAGAGDTMTLDLDLERTTVAAVKAAVDTHLEALWRASGVRILRSDLPFRGIDLSFQDGKLALDRILSSCRIGNGSTLYAQWPREEGKSARRKRYGKGGESKAVVERRRGKEREGQKAGRKDREGTAKRTVSGVVEDSPRSASEAGGHEQSASAWVADDRPFDEIDIDIEPEGDLAGVGGEAAQRLGWEIVEEAHNAQQQVEEEVQGRRPTEEGDQDDQLADNDSDKENREPLLIPIVQVRVDHDRAEEWSGFDESNSGVGVDLREEVLEF